MNSILYNKIGKNYNNTRKADIRIFNKLMELLDCPKNSKIADIGAGTGNYSYLFAENNFIVDAIEPSPLMVKNSKKHKNIKWILSSAEKINAENEAYDGAVCTLACHHFSSLEKSFNEIYRVLKLNSNFVIFTADPSKTEKDCWINWYFKDLVREAESKFLSMEVFSGLLEKIFNDKPQVILFDLPYDLTDCFFYSGWRCPEKYLDADFRNGISSFSGADEKLVDKIVKKLKKDMESGLWEKRYSYIRKLEKYNCGYFFVSVKKKATADFSALQCRILRSQR